MRYSPRSVRQLVAGTGLAFAAAFVFSTAVPSAARAADDFTPGQKLQMETVIHDYLMKNPQVLIDALNAYQDHQQEAANRKFKDKVGDYKGFLTSADAPYAGNPKGDVTIVEFFDYNCGYCKHAVGDVKKLIDGDKNVKVIFKDFPILAPSSNDAARFALASNKQGKYFDFYQALMAYPGEKNEDAYQKIAKDLNLDWDKLKSDADSSDVRNAVEKNLEVGRELGINGTPAFIFDNELVPGYIGVQNMQQMVAKVRKQNG
jgi:protein-disulfide isomerase